MNEITTALLGLSTLLGISGCGAKQSNSQQTMNEDDGYTFVATLFCSTDGPNSSPAHYYLKNPDGTLYLDIHNEENDLTPDTLLDGKIFVYYWNVVSYAFFCKRPEAGKPIEYASEMNGRPSRVVPISRSTARGSSSSNMRTCREERKANVSLWTSTPTRKLPQERRSPSYKTASGEDSSSAMSRVNG